MKSIFTFLCLAVCFAINAQNPELFNHTWYLDKMVIGNSDHFPPSNSEVEHVAVYFFDQNDDIFSTQVCSSASGIVTFDNSVDTFAFFSGWTQTLEHCAPGGNLSFENMYFSFFGNYITDDFQYNVNTNSDGSKTLTVTNIVGDQAIYNNVLLSTEQFEDRSFAVFPNPVKNVLSVESNSVIERIVIYDMLGNKALSFVKKSASYDISALQNGIYFLEIISNQGSVFKKILKK